MMARRKKVNVGSGLSAADARRLASDRSDESRRLLAANLGTTYAGSALTAGERSLADDIVRVMARDVAPVVRAALSTSIRFSSDLPVDVARQLANDVAEVAIPMLSASELLTDADLAEIVRVHGPAHRGAIAERRIVSAVVSEALVDSGDIGAVSLLVANPGANLADPLLLRVVDEYGRHEQVATPLADRDGLSIKIAERLMEAVTAEMARQSGIDMAGPTAANELLLLHPEGELRDLGELLWRLIDEGRVGPDFLAVAAAAGEREMVDILLARLADMSLGRVRTMLTVKAGQDALFDLLQLPQGARQTIRRLYSAPLTA
jgi:uncharacterized protein (DUF2336 family)